MEKDMLTDCAGSGGGLSVEVEIVKFITNSIRIIYQTLQFR